VKFGVHMVIYFKCMETVGKFEVMSHKFMMGISANGKGTSCGRSFTCVGEKPRKSCWPNYGLY
jgi:hypothetical protein